MNELDQLPEDRRDAARTALSAAFGQQPLTDMRLLSDGISGAAIWRIVVGGRPFVLRVEPERIASHDRQRGYICMQEAASAGVAPPLLYANPMVGVAIMDFVAPRPLDEHPRGLVGAMGDLGALIAFLQKTTRFPLLSGQSDVVADLLGQLRASDLFAPGLLDRHTEGLARIRAAYPWDPSTLVSCHNDPNPRNVLFDGHRLWLVDWELAGRNDPLFDAAIVTLERANTPELEAATLAAVLRRPADPVDKARLAVVRLLARLFYGCVALEAFAGQPTPEANLDALTPQEFLGSVRSMASSADINWAFGKMSLRAFLDGLADPGFAAVLDEARTTS